MAITTYAGYKAALKQTVELLNLTSFTSIANAYFSCWNGTLAGANTANGVVPTDADTSLPNYSSGIDPFGAGTEGYVTRFWHVNQGANSTVGTCTLFDMVFKAGAYAFNANTVLASQPSFSSRMPLGGTDFTGTEIWIEAVTAFTGNLSVAVTYTNQSGTAARTTGTVATGVAPTVRRAIRLPLQAGDTGVQKIESVVATVSTAGTFNVLVLRRLAMARLQSGTQQPVFPNMNAGDALMGGMPRIFDNSCLTVMQLCDFTSSGQPYFCVEVASG